MARKHKKWSEEPEEDEIDEPLPVCPLCKREIPKDARQSMHHLIPKLKGGRKGPTVLLHQLCHDEIHAAFKENQLAKTYNTIEALRASDELFGFVEWVAKKPADFDSSSLKSVRRRGR